MDIWTATSIFHLVVEHQSFSRAAAAKYASVSSISKQITYLEEALQTQLLRRSTRQLSLTEAGERYYQESKRLHGEFKTLTTSITNLDNDISGTLNITAPVPFGESILAHQLPAFQKLHPKLSINLQLNNNYVDLINDNFDCGIRMGEIDNKQFQADLLMQSQIGLFAAPTFLASNPIQSAQDLRSAPCLTHQDFKPSHLWRLKGERIQVKPILQVNGINTLISAASSGLGIVYLSEYLVSEHVKSGVLRPVLPTVWAAPISIYLYYPRSSFIPEKVTAFSNYLQSTLQK